MSTKGYAIAPINGDPIVKTVADTRRAAIVNWLHTDGGWTIYGGMNDATIEKMWLATKGGAHGVEVVSVDISRAGASE